MATDLGRKPVKTAGAKHDAFVQTQLDRAEKRIRLLDVGAALFGFACLVCVFIAAASLCDRAWSLPEWVRGLSLGCFLLGGGVYLYYTLARPLLYRVNPYYSAQPRRAHDAGGEEQRRYLARCTATATRAGHSCRRGPEGREGFVEGRHRPRVQHSPSRVERRRGRSLLRRPGRLLPVSRRRSIFPSRPRSHAVLLRRPAADHAHYHPPSHRRRHGDDQAACDHRGDRTAARFPIREAPMRSKCCTAIRRTSRTCRRA